MRLLRFNAPTTNEAVVRWRQKLFEELDQMAEEIGSNNAMVLSNELQSRAEAINTQTFTYLSYGQEWIRNIKANMPYFTENKTWDFAVRESAISVGAGPSMTDADLEALKDYKGVVFCCNKTLARLLKYRTPHFLALIHGTEELIPHFEPEIVRENLSKIHIFISTAISPAVVKVIVAYGDPKKIHWFNSTVPEPVSGDYDRIIAELAPYPTIDTGGNVGIFGCILAANMNAKKVGMLGMEHALKLTYDWTNDEAALMSYHFFPEQKQLFALPPVFRNYVSTIMSWYPAVRNKTELVNLSPDGLFYFNQKQYGIRYMGLKDFIKEYK